MGMYNEVFKNCPDCGEKCEIQISVIVPGFGQFSLDDLHTFEKLTENELRLVKECLKDEEFWCAKCNDSFLYNGKKNKLEIKKIKQILFDEEYNDE